MASEWNLWVWLECIGVVSGCCCKEVVLAIWQPSPKSFLSVSSMLCTNLAA